MAGAYSGSGVLTYTVAGLSFPTNLSVTSTLAPIFDQTVAAAKIGSLTTRGSATAGTLTMNAGHGFTTGARLDIYWDGGRRYGVTIGTVSTNSVPFTGGAGDDLPVTSTAVTAMLPTVVTPFAVTGDQAQAVLAGVGSAFAGTVIYAASDNSTILAILLTSAIKSYVWVTGQGTNPLAGTTVAKVYISHSNSGGSVDISGAVQANIP